MTNLFLEEFATLTLMGAGVLLGFSLLEAVFVWVLS